MEREQLSLQGPETYYYLNQVKGGPPRCRSTGPAQGGVPAWGLGEGGRGRPGPIPLPLSPAVLGRAAPAGSRTRTMPRTSQDW